MSNFSKYYCIEQIKEAETGGIGETRNAFKILVRICDLEGDQGVDGSTILNYNLK
jgi:hypothetical protein